MGPAEVRGRGVTFRRRKQPLEPWEELEERMRRPVKVEVNVELLREAPRDTIELMALGAARLNRIADALRIAPKPDGLAPQKNHAKMWRERAAFLAKTDHEKARLVSIALRAYDLKT